MGKHTGNLTQNLYVTFKITYDANPVLDKTKTNKQHSPSHAPNPNKQKHPPKQKNPTPHKPKFCKRQLSPHSLKHNMLLRVKEYLAQE